MFTNLVFVFGLFVTIGFQGKGTHDWGNQAVFRVNKLASRAVLMPHETKDAAITKQRLQSSNCQLLNGAWEFKWSGRPSQRPRDFFQPKFDATVLDRIQVPSNVEFAGYGTRLYSNMDYPFNKDPPYVMSDPPREFTNYENRNPVSSYRRYFELPKEWGVQRTLITFNGVSLAFSLWVNNRSLMGCP